MTDQQTFKIQENQDNLHQASNSDIRESVNGKTKGKLKSTSQQFEDMVLNLKLDLQYYIDEQIQRQLSYLLQHNSINSPQSEKDTVFQLTPRYFDQHETDGTLPTQTSIKKSPRQDDLKTEVESNLSSSVIHCDDCFQVQNQLEEQQNKFITLVNGSLVNIQQEFKKQLQVHSISQQSDIQQVNSDLLSSLIKQSKHMNESLKEFRIQVDIQNKKLSDVKSEILSEIQQRYKFNPELILENNENDFNQEQNQFKIQIQQLNLRITELQDQLNNQVKSNYSEKTQLFNLYEQVEVLQQDIRHQKTETTQISKELKQSRKSLTQSLSFAESPEQDQIADNYNKFRQDVIRQIRLIKQDLKLQMDLIQNSHISDIDLVKQNTNQQFNHQKQEYKQQLDHLLKRLSSDIQLAKSDIKLSVNTFEEEIRQSLDLITNKQQYDFQQLRNLINLAQSNLQREIKNQLEIQQNSNQFEQQETQDQIQNQQKQLKEINKLYQQSIEKIVEQDQITQQLMVLKQTIVADYNKQLSQQKQDITEMVGVKLDDQNNKIAVLEATLDEQIISQSSKIQQFQQEMLQQMDLNIQKQDQVAEEVIQRRLGQLNNILCTQFNIFEQQFRIIFEKCIRKIIYLRFPLEKNDHQLNLN
ncbi:hypothetical protein pb186bvf_018629 [Paramecium bursaria]